MRPLCPRLRLSLRWEKKSADPDTVHHGRLLSFPNTRVTPKACKRTRAKPARSAMYFPSAVGVNSARTSGEPSSKAARTSGPTSKACGPMQGPSQAIMSDTSAPARFKSAHKLSRTPSPFDFMDSPGPASPRQPAWAAATHRPAASQSNTGKQSATMMVQATPGSRLQQASATRPWGVAAPSCRLATPCTCCKNTGLCPICTARRSRLVCTSADRSPTWSPRFMLSQGAAETPPWRLVMSARTRVGVGQSGCIQ